MRVLITGGQKSEMASALKEQLSKNNVYYIVARKQQGNSVISTLVQDDIYTFLNVMELADILMENQIDCVIHLSNKPITSNSMKDSFDQSEENIACTIEVLEACVQANVHKIIFPSTIAVYGDVDGAITEEMLLQPVLFEGLSKKLEEKYIQNYHILYGLSYTILRFPIVYGVSSVHKLRESVIESTIKKVIENRPPIVFDNGEQKKHFLYISDAVQAIISSLKNGENQVFNICPEEKYSMKEVVSIIQSSVNEEVFHSLEEGEKSRISTRKAQIDLKWNAQVPFSNGIRLTIENIKQNDDQINRTLK
ncbi:NAD-dependent epimerase/dehydratase family protein [Niallia sp. JL1B1071]|uniref:NAD-dependent epimerase/dehydratase family protein n=1 Tax=Niallia tiangongensis TaxID=3237105 RepID=UPI0037DC6272